MNPSDFPFYRPHLSRRAILKGLGVSLTLPWMESLAWAMGENPNPGVTGPPRRWATLLFANGVNTSDWWVKGEGAGMQLSRSLKPLETHKEDLLFLDNLHIFDDTVGVHTPYFTNFLSGEKVRKGSIPDLAESIDHYMSRTIGKTTPVPNLVLGTEPSSLGSGGGSPGIYNATVTWSSRTSPVPPDIFPRQTFDRLFDVSGLIRDRSILDFVSGQAKSIQPKLDARDRDKMDAYLTAIRSIEQRIERATAEDRFEGWRPSIEEPNMERPADGKPQDVPEHIKLMLDLIVLAFQMDKTRLATMVFQKDVTGMSFNFLKGVSNTGMHSISHHRKSAETLAEYQRINEFHVQMLDHMITRMKGIDEGNDTTLLDNTMLLFGSTMRDGDVHDANDLPLILCGGSACDIKGGRALRYEKLDDRRLCNLHLSLAQRMGVPGEDGNPIQEFGNSHYPLPGLTG